MLQSAAAPALLALYVFASMVTMQYFLQLLQQTGWQARDYYHILTGENLRWLPMIFILVPAAAIAMGYGTSAYSFAAGYCILVTLLYWPWPGRAERPQWSSKFRRLMAFWALCLVLFTGVLAAFSGRRSAALTVGLAVLFLLQPLSAAALDILDRPAAQWLGRHFIRGSEDILSLHHDMRIIAVTGTNEAPVLRTALLEILSSQYSCEMASQTIHTRMDAAQVIRNRRTPKLEYLICHIDADNEDEAGAILKTLRPDIQIHSSADYYSLLDDLGAEESGLRFINGDDPVLRQFIGAETAMTYGLNRGNDVMAAVKTVNADGTTFAVEGLGMEPMPGREEDRKDEKSAAGDMEAVSAQRARGDTETTGPGTHQAVRDAVRDLCRPEFHTLLLGRENLTSLLGAACVSYALGIPHEEIRSRMERLRPIPHRLELTMRPGMRNAIVIDDAACEDALLGEEALEVLQRFDGMRILITDGFLRQGVIQEEVNRTFGARAAEICDRIILVGGEIAYGLKKGILESGYLPENLFEAADRGQALSLADSWESEEQKVVLLEAPE